METEAQKEARRAVIRAEIARLRGILAILEDCLARLIKQMTKLEEDVIDVESPYDLSVNSTWVGEKYDKALDVKTKLHKALTGYDDEMEILKGQIEAAIAKVEEEIRKKEAELAAI